MKTVMEDGSVTVDADVLYDLHLKIADTWAALQDEGGYPIDIIALAAMMVIYATFKASTHEDPYIGIEKLIYNLRIVMDPENGTIETSEVVPPGTPKGTTLH